MAKDCFVKELNGVYPDPNYNLRKVGEMIIKAKNGTGANSSARSVSAQTASIKNIGYTFASNNQTTVGITTNPTGDTGLQVSAQGAVISIPNKYSISKLSLRNGMAVDNLSEFAYCNNLKELLFDAGGGLQVQGDISILGGLTSLESLILSNAPLITGDISVLSNLNLKYFNVDNCAIINGDISVFENMTGMTYISIPNTKNIFGKISSLDKLVNLTILYITNDDLITGSLESLCEGMCDNDRESGTLAFRFNKTVTFNGQTKNNANNVSIVFSTTGCTVTINSQTSTYTKNTGTWTYPS